MSTPTCLSSGVLTTDTQVSEGRGMLHGALALEGAEVRVYDGTDNTGKLLMVVGSDPVSFFTNRPIRAVNGLFVELTGAGAEAVIYYG